MQFIMKQIKWIIFGLAGMLIVAFIVVLFTSLKIESQSDELDELKNDLKMTQDSV